MRTERAKSEPTGAKGKKAAGGVQAGQTVGDRAERQRSVANKEQKVANGFYEAIADGGMWGMPHKPRVMSEVEKDLRKHTIEQVPQAVADLEADVKRIREKMLREHTKLIRGLQELTNLQFTKVEETLSSISTDLLFEDGDDLLKAFDNVRVKWWKLLDNYRYKRMCLAFLRDGECREAWYTDGADGKDPKLVLWFYYKGRDMNWIAEIFQTGENAGMWYFTPMAYGTE